MDEADDREPRRQRRCCPIWTGSTRRRPAATWSTCLRRTGFSSPVGVGIGADLKDPTRYTVDIDQSGLGLPTRDYYLLPDAKFKAYRDAYRAYIAKMLGMAGLPQCGRRADRILALETAMAKIYWPIERLRDVDQTYHPMTRAKLRGFAPQFQWDRLLGQARASEAPDKSIVGEPSAITAAGELFASTPDDDLEGLSRFPLHQRPRAVPAQGVR